MFCCWIYLDLTKKIWKDPDPMVNVFCCYRLLSTSVRRNKSLIDILNSGPKLIYTI